MFVLGLGACRSADDAMPAPSTQPASTGPGPTSTSTSSEGSTSTTEPRPAGLWARVNLGFVSAYVVVRNGEAAIIDTGTAGNAGVIADVLEASGVGWDDVSHVVATHSHGDHIGSMAAVLRAADSAVGYAGAPDIPAIGIPGLRALGDGDQVFGLDVIATPGHTPGHISLLDSALGVLFAGDAMNGADGGVIGANPQFTPDMATAAESIGTMATYEYDEIAFGHGEPVTADGSALVVELSAGL